MAHHPLASTDISDALILDIIKQIASGGMGPVEYVRDSLFF
jgi:hypothetical protein